jgi:hypothetical protein
MCRMHATVCKQQHTEIFFQAPLEFSNPIEGPDSQPNGRTVFVPAIGDFVLFPSYLPHTVPMRLLRDKLQPRISIAFNIWLAGPGLDRCSPPLFAAGLPVYFCKYM